MESKAAITKSLSDTFYALGEAISRFDDTNFNEKPAKGNWSPAMVTQHLVLAGTGVDKVLLGNTKPTEADASDKVAQIKAIFFRF